MGLIANLYALIGADTSGLKKGLAETKSGLNKTKQDFKSMGSVGKTTFTELSSAINVANQVWGAAQGFIRDTAGEVVNYARQVRGLQTAIGATPEQASKLIQVADDVDISFQQLTSALEAGIRKGVKPTIENIAALSDEYLSLAPGVERTEYLMEKFGRTGQDLARLMELGSDKIGEMGDSIEGTARLMDQKALDAAEDYRVALDNLNDSAEDLRLTVGQGLLPALTDLSEWANRNATAYNATNEAYEKGIITKGEWIRANSFLFGSEEANLAQIAEVVRKLKEEEERLRIASNGWSDYNGQIDIGAGRNRTYVQTIVDVVKWEENHAAALAITAGQYARAQEEAKRAQDWVSQFASSTRDSVSALDSLNSMDYNFASKIKDQMDKIEWEQMGGDAIQRAFDQINLALEDDQISKEEADAAFAELYAATETAQGKMDGLSTTQIAKNITDGIETPLVTAEQQAAATIAAIEAGTLKEYVYNITLKYGVTGGTGKYGVGNIIQGVVPKPSGSSSGGSTHASGGILAPGELGTVGEAGWEYALGLPGGGAQIFSHGQSQNMALGGGDTYINNIYQLPGEDIGSLAARVVAMLSRGNRRARAGAGYAGV